MRTMLVLGTCLAALVSVPARAEVQVDIVVGAAAPRLERFAAQELAGLLGRLYQAQVRVVEANKAPAAAASSVILLGRPETNPLVAEAAGAAWPELSPQGHLLRTVAWREREVLIVGGGSDVATLWAAYELGYRYGMRYLLHGDVVPADPPPFHLDGFNLVLEPQLTIRGWRALDALPTGTASWGLQDQRQLLGQLAKLKFNRLVLRVHAWQPFVHFSAGGVAKETGVLSFGQRFPVTGDTAGRRAFGGAPEFINPDFEGRETYAQRLEAGVRLVGGLIEAAHELGMTAALEFCPVEFPHEFAAAFESSEPVQLSEDLSIGPGARQAPEDSRLIELVTSQWQAYLATYPELDALYLALPEFPTWTAYGEASWSRLVRRANIAEPPAWPVLVERASRLANSAPDAPGLAVLQGHVTALDLLSGLLAEPKLRRRPDGRELETVLVGVHPALYSELKPLVGAHGALHQPLPTAGHTADRAELLAAVPVARVPSDMIMTLTSARAGILPQRATGHVHRLATQLHAGGWRGYATSYAVAGDLSPTLHYLSRAACDAAVTPQSAQVELIDAVSGEGVADRVIKGFEMIERATDLIDRHDFLFAYPNPDLVLKHYAATEPPPAWWAEVKQLYTEAMNEMYRGNTRARAGSRPFTLYYAKRFEFALHYMSCVEAVRAAGVARHANQPDQQLAQLELAAEALYNALSAYSDVARDPSDRAVIAVLNEFGYRPLQQEIERLAK